MRLREVTISGWTKGAEEGPAEGAAAASTHFIGAWAAMARV